MRRLRRKVLIAAFAASLLLHAGIALFVRPGVPRTDFPEFVSIAKRTTIRATLPTPPPRVVRAAPRRAFRPRTIVSLPVTPKNPNADRRGAAPPAPSIPATPASPEPRRPSSAPAPVATTAGAACSRPDAPVAVAVMPPVPPLTSQARASQTAGVSAIAVRLDQTGRVLDASVTSTSGNVSLDLAAAEMARAATYSPSYQACKPIAGDYTFTVKFSGW
ncbi:MAG: TonB family protein [Candidatus Eremiobacteraeota bacterium]|nr:TonB family protein [Candidatus Eremiobacteraeota bacterium]